MYFWCLLETTFDGINWIDNLSRFRINGIIPNKIRYCGFQFSNHILSTNNDEQRFRHFALRPQIVSLFLAIQ